jgi:hypothetical protein
VGYLRSVAATFDLAITEAVAQCPAAEALSETDESQEIISGEVLPRY